jgi:hypothetical protein
VDDEEANGGNREWGGDIPGKADSKCKTLELQRVQRKGRRRVETQQESQVIKGMAYLRTLLMLVNFGITLALTREKEGDTGHKNWNQE